MSQNQSRLWSSADLFSMYVSFGGLLQKRQLVLNVLKYFGDSIIALSGNGVANVYAFKTKENSFIKQEYESQDIDTMWIRKVGLKIRKEIEEIPSNRKHYQTRVNLKNIMENVSPTLLTLLCEISNSFKSSLMAGMIGNMITSTVNQLAQPIQVGIGVLLQRKSLIDTLYRFRV